MANEIIITAKADKQLDKIDPRYKQAVINAIASLISFPDVNLDIVKIKGKDGEYRIRVGRYRVLFEWIDNKPKIIEIKEIKKRDEQTYSKH